MSAMSELDIEFQLAWTTTGPQMHPTGMTHDSGNWEIVFSDENRVSLYSTFDKSRVWEMDTRLETAIAWVGSGI